MTDVLKVESEALQSSSQVTKLHVFQRYFPPGKSFAVNNCSSMKLTSIEVKTDTGQ
jgi:hypothetical protein